VTTVYGLWSLVDRIVPPWLPSIHARLPSGFSSMNDIMRWLNWHRGYDICSFDIFDTLLRRRIDPPEVIKLLASQHMSELLARLGISIGSEEILALRNKAEEWLRYEAKLQGKDGQCHLTDIVKRMLIEMKADNILNWRDIVNYEMTLERKATEPMPGSLEILTYLKSRGKRVVGISETYLAEDQIATLLQCHGLIQYIDELYVSSDIGKGKLSGKLFQHVIENEGTRIVHIGDNYQLDYAKPRSLGIKALWFHSKSEALRKSKLMRLRASSNKLDYVNTVIRSANRHQSVLYQMGYEILGPALTVFIHNMVELAQKDGIEMLFFVARDGYAMKKIYETLRDDMYADRRLPPAKYMCIGREPVRLASLSKLTVTEILEIQAYMIGSGKRNITLRDVLRSYGMEADDFNRNVNKYDIDFDEIIVDPCQNNRLQEVLQSTNFRNFIQEKSDEARKLLRDYLVNIEFFRKHRVAFVDGQSEGLTKLLLERALAEDGGYPITYGYYFDLVNLGARKAGANFGLSRVKGIVSDWQISGQLAQLPFINIGVLLEIFAHPNHGLTVGYKEVNGKTVPLFRRTPQESQYPITSQGLQGVLAYAKDYSIYYGLHNYSAEELLECLRTHIVNWVRHPPRRHAKALANMFWTNDWPYQVNYALGQKLDASDIIHPWRLKGKVASSRWPEFTLMSAPYSIFLANRVLNFINIRLAASLRLIRHIVGLQRGDLE